MSSFPGSHSTRRRVVNPRIPDSEFEERFAANENILCGPFDFIIVGAGASGCVLANKISSNPSFSVLLLEAGGEGQNSGMCRVPAHAFGMCGTEMDWLDQGLSYTTPQKHLNNRRLELNQGLSLGGSSAINWMMWVRGQPQDFDAWAEHYGCGPDWAFASVQGNFCNLEAVTEKAVPGFESTMRGSKGPLEPRTLWPPPSETQAFIESATRCGIPRSGDYNGSQQAGAHHTQFAVMSQFRSRADAFSVWVEPVWRHRPNLTIASRAFVRKLLLEDGDGSLQVAGVEVELPSGLVLPVRARREVLLCAGAIRSPVILMLSGIGDHKELQAAGVECKAHVPAVGKHLQDHPAIGVAHRAPSGFPVRLEGSGCNGIAFFESAVAKRRSAEGAPRGPDIAIVQVSRVVPEDAVSKMIRAKLGELLIGVGRLRAPISKMAVAAALKMAPNQVQQDGQRVLGVAINFNHPASRGSVRLQCADPHAPPLVDPNYLDDDADMEAMVCALKCVRELLHTSPFSDYAPEPALEPSGFAQMSDEELQADIRRRMTTAWHYCGSCRMGPVGSSEVVCDPRLRVQGVGRLRVADAAVMPRITSSNTYAPTLMIADKCADMVLQDHPTASL